MQPSLVEGRVIHCLLLDNGSFDSQFIVSPGKIPEGNNRLVVDTVYKKMLELGTTANKLADCSELILETLREINLHQSLVDDKKGEVTGDRKRLDKILSPENMEYFKYLRERRGRTVIDQPTLERCTEIVSLLKNHKKVSFMLGLDGFGKDTSHLEIYNEKELKCDLKAYPFNLKGILDNYVIDHQKKIIRINDLKTTGKSLKEFKESVDYYRYDIQTVMQCLLVASTHKLEGYDVEFHFIVIDKYKQIYPFRVSPETLQFWTDRFTGVLEMAAWHYVSKNYELPYEFVKEEVTL